MIIQCEFTNARNSVRECVVFLTDMKLMIDSNDQPFYLWCDYPKTNKSMVNLQKAMQDPAFRIYLDRDGLTMIGPMRDWAVSCIAFNFGHRDRIYYKICIIQRAFRRRFMRRRLAIDRVFSKTAAACGVLRLPDDVLRVVVAHCLAITHRSQHPRSKPLKWVKPDKIMDVR